MCVCAHGKLVAREILPKWHTHTRTQVIPVPTRCGQEESCAGQKQKSTAQHAAAGAQLLFGKSFCESARARDVFIARRSRLTMADLFALACTAAAAAAVALQFVNKLRANRNGNFDAVCYDARSKVLSCGCRATSCSGTLDSSFGNYELERTLRAKEANAGAL